MEKSVISKKYDNLRLELINARKSVNLTQVELSKKLSRPQSFVSKYEHGERRLDVIEFIEIAECIGIDPFKLLKKIIKNRNELFVR